VALVKGLPVADVARATTENFERLFVRVGEAPGSRSCT
jgi:Tat protein secretion system quality control protein TatD with DNase activity